MPTAEAHELESGRVAVTDRERYEHVHRIFTCATDLPEEERSTYLEAECGDDVGLLHEIRDMLAQEPSAAGFLDPGALDGPIETLRAHAESSRNALLGRTIGGCCLKRVLARGGMGTVYEAEQQAPKRTVAVKIMRRGIASPTALRRFEFESQVLAHLRHPCIAQVFEAGTYEDGDERCPYFVMELIPNARSITRYARDNNLSDRQRLELVEKVCEAVHHGHQRGVVHRDLKPDNILVDSSGEPKVIDYGVARSTGADFAQTLQTEVGQLVGTLQYMSPEQCGSDPHDLDIRSDIYSLGVVLFELLCGQLPYDVRDAAIPEAIGIVQDETPVRPSTIDRRFKGDVETIALKALHKERELRYQSALGFAQDIRRYLNGEAILARPASAMYQLRKLARRYRGVVTALTALFVILVLGVTVSVWFAFRAADQRDQARAMALTNAATSASQTDPALALLLALEGVEVHRTVEAISAVHAILPEMRERVLVRHGGAVNDARWLADGGFVTACADGFLRIFSAEGTLLQRLSHLDEAAFTSVAPSNDGDQLLASDVDGRLLLFSLRDETTRQIPSSGERAHAGRITWVNWSADGRHFVSSSLDNTAKVWDASEGRQVCMLDHKKGGVWSAAFSPDSEAVLTTGGRAALLWDISSPALPTELRRYPGRNLRHAALTEDQRVVTAGLGAVELWDGEGAPAARAIPIDAGNFFNVEPLARGRFLLSIGDNTARVIRSNGKTEFSLLGHGQLILVCARQDEVTGRILTASGDGTARVWEATVPEVPSLYHESDTRAAAFSPEMERSSPWKLAAGVCGPPRVDRSKPSRSPYAPTSFDRSPLLSRRMEVGSLPVVLV